MADKKVIDVAAPKDAKLDIGSKPMIVGHKSMATDPMMREVEDKKSHEATTTEETSVIEEVSKSDPLIAPPSERQKTIEPLKAKSEIVEDTKNSDAKKVEDDESSSDEAEKKEVDPAVLALEQEEVIRKLLEEKKYRVSIKQAKNTNKVPFFVAIGLLIAGLVTAFVLIDTKKLDIGVELPFSIFGDSETATPPTTDAITPVVEQKPLESASWLKFDADTYSIRIPDGWVVTSAEGHLSVTSYEKMEFKLGESGVVIQEKIKPETDCCFFVTYNLDDTSLRNYEDETMAYIATPVILDTGVQGLRYERVLVEDESSNRPAGSTIYEYIIKNDAGNNVVVTFVLQPNSAMTIDKIELSVKSIILN